MDKKYENSTTALQHYSTTALGAVGGLLLIAAGLKSVSLAGSAVPIMGWWADRSMQSGVIATEVLLGLWLLSRVAPSAAWLAATFMFALFATVSCVLSLQGVADCGCLGVLKTAPWQTLILDIAILAVLLVFRPRWDTHDLRVGGRLIGGSVAVALISAALAYTVYGSLPRAIAKLRCETIVAPSLIDLGTAQSGEVLQHSLSVTNYSDSPIRLVGGTADCSCLTTSDMPVTLAANSMAPITVKLRVPRNSSTGVLSRNIEIWSDCDYTPKITVAVNIMVVTAK